MSNTDNTDQFTVEDLTRINNDVNGNPRYVLHYLALAGSYSEALCIARERGGRKFCNKQFGGGIVFQEYNAADLVQWVNSVHQSTNQQ